MVNKTDPEIQQDVRKIPVSASERSEFLLRRLANAPPKNIQRQRVKAVWDFDAEQPGELSFKKGDVFEANIDRELHWWQGYKNGLSGQIPANRVGLVTTTVSQPEDVRKPRCKVRALTDFHPTENTCLPFLTNDVIEVEEALYTLRWKGSLNRRQGWIPAYRVLMVSPEESFSSGNSSVARSISENVQRTVEKVRRTTDNQI